MFKNLLLALLLLTATPAFADVAQWDTVADKSTLSFSGTQMGGKFSGSFKTFTPVIAFDAAHLDQSKVSVDVDLGSMTTGDVQRDDSAKGSDWLDIKKFPVARFVSTAFTKTSDNAFEAAGNLTIRDVTLPVKLPFTLVMTSADSGKQTATMNGAMTLDRSKFKLGQGEWADPSSVGNDIAVDVHLVATQK